MGARCSSRRQLVWGILLAMVIEIPIAFVYVWLSTALPRSGGDYVFQSRVFGGGTAFTVVMSGFVIWILQWVALSGWLVSYLGFAPLFLGLGATMGNATFSSWGVWFTTATGIIIVSILNALLSLVLLVSGFKNYVRFQHVIFWGTLLCFATVFIVLFTTPASEFVARLNAFAVASGGAPNFYETAVGAVQNAGIDLHPPFSLLATLLIAPIAWTSLAVGDLLRRAERRDQGCTQLPVTDLHYGRLARSPPACCWPCWPSASSAWLRRSS